MPERYLIYQLERRAYPLRQPLFTVGRDAESDIIVREPTVSRTHARLTIDGDDVVLENLGPTGTRVNGEAVLASRKLQQGDDILIGTATLTFTAGPVPTGFTVVDGAASRQPDPDTRRSTIRTPLLPTDGIKARPAASAMTWMLVAALVIVTALFVFTRG